MKWLVSISGFDPFGAITLKRSRRDIQWSNLIPILGSGMLNQKLAACTQKSVMQLLYGHNDVEYLGELFWLHAPLTNLHRNVRDSLYPVKFIHQCCYRAVMSSSFTQFKCLSTEPGSLTSRSSAICWCIYAQIKDAWKCEGSDVYNVWHGRIYFRM